MVTRQPQVERRTAKVRLSETDVLPLSHETNRQVWLKFISFWEILSKAIYVTYCGLWRPDPTATVSHFMPCTWTACANMQQILFICFKNGCVYSTGTGTLNPWSNQYGQHRYTTTKPIYYTNLSPYCICWWTSTGSTVTTQFQLNNIHKRANTACTLENTQKMWT